MSNQAASVESSLPRYTAWKHLHDKAQWPGAVPDWAKDYSGRMNDGVAAQAVIEELRAEVTRLAAQAAPSEPTVSLAKSRIGRVYLAGPMTGYENFNFPAFNAAAQRLRAEGFDVVNPADHGIVDGAEWADYLRFDLGKLAQCESIALLPGWEVSKGANLEVSVAQKLGMVVRCLDGAAQPSQAPVVQAVRHVCGLQGFGAIGDVCPACAADRAHIEASRTIPASGVIGDQ